jgi:hypothetical protein
MVRSFTRIDSLRGGIEYHQATLSLALQARSQSAGTSVRLDHHYDRSAALGHPLFFLKMEEAVQSLFNFKRD